jgi:hypothetical protein
MSNCNANEYVPINNTDNYKGCMKCTTINNKFLAINDDNNVYTTKKDYNNISNPPSGGWTKISEPIKGGKFMLFGMMELPSSVISHIICYDGYLYANSASYLSGFYRRIADTTNREWQWYPFSGQVTYLEGWKQNNNINFMYGTGTDSQVYRIQIGTNRGWELAAHCCVTQIKIYKDILYGLAGGSIYTWKIYAGPPWALLPNNKSMKYFIIKNDYIYGIQGDNSVWKRTLTGTWYQIIGPEQPLLEITEYKNYLYGLGTDLQIYNCSINGGSWSLLPMLGARIVKLVISDNGIFYGIGTDNRTLYYKQYIDGIDSCKNFISGITNVLTCDNNNINSQCQTFFNSIGYPNKFSDFGFKNDSNVNNKNYLSKNNSSEYTCASYDGKTCIENIDKNARVTKPLKNITCKTYNQTKSDSGENINPSDLCQKAFDYYNLYPSTNPLVIKGRNINQAIPNTIDNNLTLQNLASIYKNNLININTPEGIKNGINTLMNDAPIKLACCGRTNNTNNTALPLNTRVPLSPNVASQNPLLKSFNFQNEIITIPPNSCPANLTPNSTDCNAFFGVYCENVINTFNKQNLPQKEFINYAPECACYVPKTPEQKYYPAGAPSICYKDGCTQNSISYLDTTSQGPNAKCDMTICQNIVNTAGLTAGGNANITPTLQNQCGQYIPPEPEQKIKPKSSPNTASQSSPNTTSQSSPDTASQSSSDTSSTNIIIITIIIIFLLLCSSSIYFITKKK